MLCRMLYLQSGVYCLCFVCVHFICRGRWSLLANRLTLSLRNYFLGFRRNLNMLFSIMCWLFCYCFLITIDTTVHHISNESEDM